MRAGSEERTEHDHRREHHAEQWETVDPGEDEKHFHKAHQRADQGAASHLERHALGVGRGGGQADRCGGDQGHGGAAGPGGGHPVAAQRNQDERRANARGGAGQPVGFGDEGLVPLLARVAVVGQGRVGLRVVVQVVDKAVKQLVGGVKIQLLGFARVALLKARAQAAHFGGQAVLVGAQLVDQARGVGTGEGATGETVEHFGEVLQAGLDGRHHVVGRIGAQAFEQLVQGIEARGDAHEFAVEAAEPTIAPTHMRVFKYRDAAQPFQADRFGDKAHVAGLEPFTLAAPAQAVGDEQREHAKALIQRVAHGRAAGLRQDCGADQRGAQDPQGDFQHPPDRRHKCAVRMGQGWQANHRRRVTGQHKPIGAKVAVARGAGGAEADPDGQRAEKQLGVLREHGDQQHHHRRPRQGAEETVETLGEHLAALRLHHDKHGDHRRARLRQFQAHGQPQGEERGDQHLEDIHPGHAIAACPVEKTTAPLKGMQPAQRCRQGSHRILLSDQTRPAPPGFCSGGSGLVAAHRYRHRGHHQAPSPIQRGR